ncbi:MAG: hypothetical protein ACRCY5_07005, partial [Phocaeicola sp.]
MDNLIDDNLFKKGLEYAFQIIPRANTFLEFSDAILDYSKPSVNSVYYSCFFLLTFVAKTKSMVYWNLAYFKHLYEEYITSGTS